jgi:hypothetical protein
VQDILKPTKTVFTVSQFLDWQRSKTLELNPIFQRRPVWKKPAKSQFIDSLVRGYPIPIILLRQIQDLKTLAIKMEVVDGQQRLRTLLSFIDPSSLPDFDQEKDKFEVAKIHNPSIADTPFSKLPASIKQAMLSYELSTHVFPATTGDELVFRIFARLNSTGLSLNKQEIRNSEFHGAFKSLVYELAFENLDKWRKWKVFTNDAISRMDEAEGVSEYIIAFSQGVTAKDQKKISEFYETHEDKFPRSTLVRQRFEAVMNGIEQSFGDFIGLTAFQRPALFYSLFLALYHHMYGLGSPIKKTKPKSLPSGIGNALKKLSERIKSKDLPDDVQDAMDKATADKARRDQRHRFIMKALHLDPAV